MPRPATSSTPGVTPCSIVWTRRSAGGTASPRRASSRCSTRCAPQQVDTLFLDGGVTRDGRLWVGENPSQVASDAEQLRALGSEPVIEVPIDDALLRAAAASGAAFEPLGGGRTGLVGKPVDDGVAALLRYPLVARQG